MLEKSIDSKVRANKLEFNDNFKDKCQQTPKMKCQFKKKRKVFKKMNGPRDKSLKTYQEIEIGNKLTGCHIARSKGSYNVHESHGYHFLVSIKAVSFN